jgi:apolipoprotein N-acyltransferase
VLAATLLLRPRLPGEAGTGERLLLLPALVCLLWPAHPAFRLGSAASLAYVLGHLAGLLGVYRWLSPILVEQLGWSSVRAMAVLIMTGVAAATGRLLMGWAAGRLALALTPWPGCLAGGLLFADLELAVSFLAPFTEPLLLSFAAADLPGGAGLLRAGGPGLLTAAVITLVLALLQLRSRSARRTAGLVAGGVLWGILALGLWPSPASTAADLPLVGLQLGQTFPGPHWQEQQLAAYLALERSPAGGVVVWPERAYPYRERIERRGGLLRLPPPRGYSRVLGLHAWRGFAAVNAVGIQEQGRAGIRLREKRRLVPLFESGHLRVGRPLEEAVTLAGRPLLLPICYEILDRRTFTGQAALLGISVSADTFDPSGAASRIMTRATWLRALECGIPFVRVSDASSSAAFAADGTVLALLGRGPGLLRQHIQVPAMARTCGQGQRLWLGLLCGVVIVTVVTKRGKTTGGPPGPSSSDGCGGPSWAWAAPRAA